MSLEQNQPGTRRKINLGLFLLPVIILACGLLVAFWMMQSGPKAKARQKVRTAVLVDVRPVEYTSHQTMVSVMGTVKAKREIDLKPEVGGKVIALGKGLVPGGIVQSGETLLTIDPRDYELNVKQLANSVSSAAADLKLEAGKQIVARKEYEMLGEEVSSEELSLILREPQLESARANLDAARIKLEQAELDLQRTNITAPFNAVVTARQVNIGTSVSSSTSLATLVGTDSFWVEAAVPVSKLKWIRAGNNGQPSSSARIYDTSAWGEKLYRKGETAGLTGSLEEQGRLATLLIEVPAPLSQKNDQPRLLLGSYVRVDIEGERVPHATAIERRLIHDGNQVWVMDTDDRLDIRTVKIAYRGVDHVLVTDGLQEGERLVISSLSSPVHGMALRVTDQTDSGTEKDTP